MFRPLGMHHICRQFVGLQLFVGVPTRSNGQISTNLQMFVCIPTQPKNQISTNKLAWALNNQYVCLSVLTALPPISFVNIYEFPIQCYLIQFNFQFDSISVQFHSIQLYSITVHSIQFNSIQFNSIPVHSIIISITFHSIPWTSTKLSRRNGTEWNEM